MRKDLVKRVDKTLNNKPSILFLGRFKCEGSEQIYQKLKKVGFIVTFVVSKKRGERLPSEASDWVGDYILCFRS